METSTWHVKKEMCEIGHRIWLKGFCAGNEGNHSVRIGPDRVLVTPTGLSKGFLSPDEICVVDMDGKQIEANPRGRKRTSEVLVHLAIYKKREDIKAVIHSHPPHATAFACAEVQIPEGVHPEAEVFLGRVPFAKYALPSTQALPDSITPLIKAETNTVVMGQHGTVSFDTSLLGAYYKLEILDAYCRLLLLTAQLGGPKVFSPREMKELLEVKAKFGIKDPRLSCAAEGCVGEVNDDFFKVIEDGKEPHACSCESKPQAKASTGPIQDAVAQAAKSFKGTLSTAEFDAVVQAITDQIMAQAK